MEAVYIPVGHSAYATKGSAACNVIYHHMRTGVCSVGPSMWSSWKPQLCDTFTSMVLPLYIGVGRA